MRHTQKRESTDYHPLAGILPADRRKRGIYMQVYASNGGALVWAGAHYVPEISARTAYRLEQHWRRWRRWYDNLPANRKRSYPAKEGPRHATRLCVFPVSEPAAARNFNMPGMNCKPDAGSQRPATI